MTHLQVTCNVLFVCFLCIYLCQTKYHKHKPKQNKTKQKKIEFKFYKKKGIYGQSAMTARSHTAGTGNNRRALTNHSMNSSFSFVSAPNTHFGFFPANVILFFFFVFGFFFVLRFEMYVFRTFGIFFCFCVFLFLFFFSLCADR